MNMSGPIEPIVGKKPVDRSTLPLAVGWVCRPGAKLDARAPLPEAAPFVASNGRDDRIDTSSPTDTVAFLLGPEPPGAATQAILEAADCGSRVYVLASPGFGEGRRDPGLGSRRQARVLVRRLEGLPFSGWIADRGARAGLWLGATPDAAPSWWLPLSRAQGEAFFRVFLHLFWHEAKDEAWTGSGPLAFRAAADRPFDVPLPGPSAPVRLFSAAAPPMASRAGDVLYLPKGEPPSDAARPSILITRPQPTGMEALASLVRGGTRVLWEDLGLPTFCAAAAGGELEAASAAMHVRIVLERAQSEGLLRAVAAAEQRRAFRLLVDVPLGAIEGDVWLPGRDAPAALLRSKPVDAGRVDASALRAMPETPAKALPEPPALALSVIYHWTVHPPRAPAGATTDSLVVGWQQLDRAVKTQAEALRDRLSAVERHEGTLARAFATLASVVLGFGRERVRIREALDAFVAERPSAVGPARAHEILERLAEAEKSIAALEDDLNKEERKAREQQDREKQKRVWEERRREAEEALAKCRKELASRREEQKRIDAELGEIAHGGGPREPKDREAKSKLLRGEGDSVSKRIERLEAEVRGHEATLQETFEYRPSHAPEPRQRDEGRTSGSMRFVPKASPQAPEQRVPREAPPGVGQLVHTKGTRYLVITRWEDLDAGEREAERLGAQLVAPAEGA